MELGEVVAGLLPSRRHPLARRPSPRAGVVQHGSQEARQQELMVELELLEQGVVGVGPVWNPHPQTRRRRW